LTRAVVLRYHSPINLIMPLISLFCEFKTAVGNSHHLRSGQI